MPEQTHINVFRKINTDLHVLEQQPGDYLDLLNGRLFQHEGEGLVVTNVRGMEEKFSLNGFTPIGYTVYNDVMYIVSYHPSYEGEPYLEIGSYPSPDYDTCSGWKEEYQPLRNFTGGINYNEGPYTQDDCGNTGVSVPALPMRIPARFTGWDCTPLDIFARESYDGSVNLYIADGRTPNIVLNNGFHHETGVCLPRYFSEADFQGNTVHQFNESCKLPQLFLHEITQDGTLPAGNIIFYARYNNAQRAPTSFIAASGPIQIALSRQAGPADSIDTFGGEGSMQTNKAVTLRIRNLSTQYSHLEIGYIYFHSGLAEAYVIDRKFAIAGNPEIFVKITGVEVKTQVEPEYLMKLKPYTKTAKAHTELFNTYYGANWSGTIRHHPELCDYALCVRIGEEKIALKEDVNENANLTQLTGQHNAFNYEKDTEQFTGYFSGETYAFLLHPVYYDGQIGPGYPMTGYDNWDGTLQNPNQKGIFRFSHPAISPIYDGTSIYVKRATFDFTDCVQTGWIQQNVCGWYISRALRRENLLCQGISLQCYNGYKSIFSAGSPDAECLDRWVPLMDAQSYYFQKLVNLGTSQRQFWYGDGGNIGNNTAPLVGYHREVPNKYGVLSLDYMLDMAQGKEIASTGFIGRIGAVSFDPVNHTGPTDSGVRNTELSHYYQDGFGPFDTGTELVRIRNVAGFDYAGNAGFVSRFETGQNPLNNSMYYHNADQNDFVLNLPMAWNAYVGIETTTGLDWDKWLVNVYNEQPGEIDYANWYDLQANNFYIIGHYIPNGVMGLQRRGHGDCFPQRIWMKHITSGRDYSEQLLEEMAPKLQYGTEQDGYGHGISFVCECKYNAAMRYEKGGNKFYPATGWRDSGTFFYDEVPESNLYNLGYIQVLSPRTLPAYDPQKVYGDEQYKTRILFTNQQVIQGVEDAYRTSGAAQVQDFDLQYGSINALIPWQNSLVSVQDRAVSVHPIMERAIGETSQGNTAILGVTMSLGEYVQMASDIYGSRHRDSVVRGENGIYGIDTHKRTIWRLGQGMEILSHTKLVDTLVQKILGQKGKESNITRQWADQHTCGEGIHAVYDLSHKEVLFTFRYPDGESYTLAFSEKMEAFTHRFSFTPSFYLALNEDLFSFADGKVWLHDCTDEHNTF